MNEKILIVDDSVINRKLLFNILKKEGYQLLEAKNGEEAINIALNELPDLILLDIIMPKKDGFQVCVELKRNPATKNIPIIFLSAKTDVEDKVKGLELGASDYITKPFEKIEIVARVRTHLKIYNLTKQLIKARNELLEKQRQIEEDLEAAAEIQKSLLPSSLFPNKYIEAAWRFMPCEKVGGDIFNLFSLDENHWAIYILDVSGHGVPSAMISVSVSQLMRPQLGFIVKRSIKPPPYYELVPPSEVLMNLDQQFLFERFDRFFTISYLLLNINTGVVRYSSAGHPPPILLRKDGTIEFLKEGGPIIGLGSSIPFEEGKKKLEKGDKLFLYTDGIIEYQNKVGDFFGEKRFCEKLVNLIDKPVSIIVEDIINSLMEFGNNNKPQDDITLLGLEFKGILS